MAKRSPGLFAGFLRVAREERAMSDSESGKLDEMTSRIKEAVASAESHLDVEGLLHRIRDVVGKVGSTIDTNAHGSV
jgi:C4-type Zn-finger protein